MKIDGFRVKEWTWFAWSSKTPVHPSILDSQIEFQSINIRIQFDSIGKILVSIATELTEPMTCKFIFK